MINKNGGDVSMQELREDCYFYYESKEMSATVPNCSYTNYEYGFCPCSKECKYYISKAEVHKTIKEFVQSKAYKGGRENETDPD